MVIKKGSTIKAINYALASLLAGVIGILFYTIIADNRAQSQDIAKQGNQIVELQSKPSVDNSKQIDELKKQIASLGNKQISIESKLEILISLSTSTNRKIDRHMQESIPKP